LKFGSTLRSWYDASFILFPFVSGHDAYSALGQSKSGKVDKGRKAYLENCRRAGDRSYNLGILNQREASTKCGSHDNIVWPLVSASFEFRPYLCADAKSLETSLEVKESIARGMKNQRSLLLCHSAPFQSSSFTLRNTPPSGDVSIESSSSST
jgi:ribosomal protein L37E